MVSPPTYGCNDDGDERGKKHHDFCHDMMSEGDPARPPYLVSKIGGALFRNPIPFGPKNWSGNILVPNRLCCSVWNDDSTNFSVASTTWKKSERFLFFILKNVSNPRQLFTSNRNCRRLPLYTPTSSSHRCFASRCCNIYSVLSCRGALFSSSSSFFLLTHHIGFWRIIIIDDEEGKIFSRRRLSSLYLSYLHNFETLSSAGLVSLHS